MEAVAAHSAFILDSGMFSAIRYMWTASKGYRLRPWKSPYLRWRLETYFGPQAADPGAAKFFSLMWRQRKQMARFLRWADERRIEQQKRTRSPAQGV